MAYVSFNRNSSYNTAVASNNDGKIFFPTDNSNAVVIGRASGSSAPRVYGVNSNIPNIKFHVLDDIGDYDRIPHDASTLYFIKDQIVDDYNY